MVTLTSSGLMCDVCNNFIFGLFEGDVGHEFSCKGIEERLHACKKCKKVLEECGGDWTKLPEGRLRRAFE